MNRAKPQGYYWRQFIQDGLQAEKQARRELEQLNRMNNSSSATTHLFKMALALAEIQQSLYGLLDIVSRDK